MKRPPKVKNAAATARYASGAGSGTPDFYRIAKIAPLPPATAFRPVVRESKVDGDGPRYEIEPLDLKAENNFLDEMPMIGWGSAEQPLSDATIFSDPSAEDTKDSADTVLLHGQSKTTDSSTHSEDYTHSGDSSMDNSKDGHGRQQNVSLADEKADKNNPLSSLEANVDTASHDRADTDTKTEIEFEKLSTADLAYLAHQNRILLKHAETGINKDGTMRQKHKI